MFRRDGDAETEEPFAGEAKYFTESRLLQRDVKIILEGVSNQNYLGSVMHPVSPPPLAYQSSLDTDRLFHLPMAKFHGSTYYLILSLRSPFSACRILSLCSPFSTCRILSLRSPFSICCRNSELAITILRLPDSALAITILRLSNSELTINILRLQGKCEFQH